MLRSCVWHSGTPSDAASLSPCSAAGGVCAIQPRSMAPSSPLSPSPPLWTTTSRGHRSLPSPEVPCCLLLLRLPLSSPQVRLPSVHPELTSTSLLSLGGSSAYECDVDM